MRIFSPPLSLAPLLSPAPSLPLRFSPSLFPLFFILSLAPYQKHGERCPCGDARSQWDEEPIIDANYREKTRQNMKQLICRGVNHGKLFVNWQPIPELWCRITSLEALFAESEWMWLYCDFKRVSIRQKSIFTSGNPRMICFSSQDSLWFVTLLNPE